VAESMKWLAIAVGEFRAAYEPRCLLDPWASLATGQERRGDLRSLQAIEIKLVA
jgi:hypothetical protein